jgi:transposase-like protein/IS1 family transposase
MECPICQGQTRRFGKNRNGSQRYRCDACRHTFTDATTRPQDKRRIDPAQLVLCLRMLLEGNSIRSTERLTGVYRNTIIAAMVEAGQKCQAFMARTLANLPVNDIQADEIWGFIGCKEKTRQRNNYPEVMGDAYCFTAMERTTKLLVCWHLGKRSPEDTRAFAEKLWFATSGRFQLTTDGYTPYQTAIPEMFGRNVDYATLVKVYNESEDGQRRYSPPIVTGIIETPRIGSPDPDRICTSHVERHNRTLRMCIRRLTRLTDAHSKKWENHEAMLALFIAYYNWCRVHSTIRTTPAVEAGLTDHVWSVQELLDKANRL